MKKYVNYIIINGERFPNIVEAADYKEALKIQEDRKAKSKKIFEGILTQAN